MRYVLSFVKSMAFGHVGGLPKGIFLGRRGR